MKMIWAGSGMVAALALVGLGAAAVSAAAPQLVSTGPPASMAGPLAIPPEMLTLYAAAASGTCPGLSWTVLAAIGKVESDHGRSSMAGVHSGRNAAGAEGPMQFEPATFALFGFPVPPGGASPPSPYDPVDAVYAAARMLCADGASRPGRLGAALYAYNHSGLYVASVVSQAEAYGRAALSAPAGAAQAVSYALAQVGTPYRWGAEAPSIGFDCSGLVQAAWASAGVALPRVASQQWALGPAVPPGSAVVPGDLVFFGPAVGDVTHVGMVVDPSGVMVDAPHTGAAVRVESFPLRVGAAWGGDMYLGATEPG